MTVTVTAFTQTLRSGFDTAPAQRAARFDSAGLDNIVTRDDAASVSGDSVIIDMSKPADAALGGESLTSVSAFKQYAEVCGTILNRTARLSVAGTSISWLATAGMTEFVKWAPQAAGALGYGALAGSAGLVFLTGKDFAHAMLPEKFAATRLGQVTEYVAGAAGAAGVIGLYSAYMGSPAGALVALVANAANNAGKAVIQVNCPGEGKEITWSEPVGVLTRLSAAAVGSGAAAAAGTAIAHASLGNDFIDKIGKSVIDYSAAFAAESVLKLAVGSKVVDFGAPAQSSLKTTAGRALNNGAAGVIAKALVAPLGGIASEGVTDATATFFGDFTQNTHRLMERTVPPEAKLKGGRQGSYDMTPRSAASSLTDVSYTSTADVPVAVSSDAVTVNMETRL